MNPPETVPDEPVRRASGSFNNVWRRSGDGWATAGEAHSLALTAHGSAFGWGDALDCVPRPGDGGGAAEGQVRAPQRYAGLRCARA